MADPVISAKGLSINDDGNRPGSGDVVGMGGAAGSERIQWGGVERGGVGIKTDRTIGDQRYTGLFPT